MPKYNVPKGGGWRGGYPGGSISHGNGKKPWSVRFGRGKKSPLIRFFEEKGVAKDWRRQYSNKNGYTMNLWRPSPNRPGVIEMTVGKEGTVLFDVDRSNLILKFVWSVGHTHRVFTSGRLINKPEGFNSLVRKVRQTQATQVSMPYFVRPEHLHPRHYTAPTARLIDNTRSNLGSIAETRRNKANIAKAKRLQVKESSGKDKSK